MEEIKWKSVDAGLPEITEPCCGNLKSPDCLIYDGQDIYIGFIERVRGSGTLIWSNDSDDIIENVTHWMPLPEPPTP